MNCGCLGVSSLCLVVTFVSAVILMGHRSLPTQITINIIFFKGTKTVQYLRNYLPHIKYYLDYSLSESKSIIQ